MLAIRLLAEGGSESGLGGLVWVALAIFFVMVVLGWLASTRGWLKKEEEPVHEAHGGEHAHTEAVLAADDLTTLEGIGPKVAKTLAGVGISTFAGLAAADEKTVREALDAAGYKYMDPSSWLEQAALAAKGDLAALKKMQSNLKGGRKQA